MNVRVTKHACERYAERVQPCSLPDARLHILESRRAIETAASFGCSVVRRGHGERLVLEGATVITVYGAHHVPHQCKPTQHPLGTGDWL